jgi:hypothetical protein
MEYRYTKNPPITEYQFKKTPIYAVQTHENAQ